MRPGPTLCDAEFRLFRDLFRSHCGLHFQPEARTLLERRLVGRMRALDVGSFAAYRWRLRAHPDAERELACIVDDLTVNESWFLRERGPLRALVEEIVPERLLGGDAAVQAPVNVWSVGCAGGEEPYSVVMLALEAGLQPGRDLRVYASDISRRALGRAREGLYRESALRECEPALRRKYFEEQGGLFRASEDLRRHVAFTHLNLLDRGRISLLPPLDAILCRNVMIYFDADTTRQVIATFEEKLRPGGHLLLGHSESLINTSSAFELRHLRNDLVYRRPLRSGPRDRFQSEAIACLAAEEAAS